MRDEQVSKMRKQHDEIHLGREGHWFDPGEYEHLKQEWFDTHAKPLLQLAEAFNEHKAELLRTTAFHIAMLVEALQAQNAINAYGVRTSTAMMDGLKAMANDILPEPNEKIAEIYQDHLSRLKQLRDYFGDNYEGRFLEGEITDTEKKLRDTQKKLKNLGATDRTDES